MPGKPSELLAERYYREIPREYSGVRIYYLPALHAYLKVGELEKNSNLAYERDALVWLSGKLPVPMLLDFEIGDGTESILISEVVGRPYSEVIASNVDATALLEHAAGEIRKMHDIGIEDCPLDQRLDSKLAKARRNISNGFVDESDFEPENLGKTGQLVYSELRAAPPPDEDLVFTHGDLCLPNIVIHHGKVSGFIDLDRAGIADRYQDIALFLRSFSLNFEGTSGLTAAFMRGYGTDSLDREKLDFYRKLDELF